MPKLRCRNKQITRQQSLMSSIGFKPKCRVRMMMLAGDNESALQIHTYILLRTTPAAPAFYSTWITCCACRTSWRMEAELAAFFCFPISYIFSSSCCWSLLLSAQRQQRKQPTLANNASESASSTPRAPAARASYCTYGTCCTCLLLHLRHLLHLPPILRLPHLLSTPADAINVVGVEGRIKCDNLARPQRLNMRIAKLATSTVNWVLCCRLCKR